MYPALQRLAAITLALGLALPCAAQTPGAPPPRGNALRIERDSAADRVVAVVYEGRFSYVRLETREPGAALNQHPASVDPQALRSLLARLQLPGSRAEPLFNDDELNELVPPLLQALARATPEQDVTFAISGQHGFMGPLAARVVTTARVFFQDGRMNLVFGLVRRDFESQYKATGYLIAFEPGKRASAVDRSAQVIAAYGAERRRADWLVLDPQATPPSAPVAAPMPPAVVVPAPAAAAATATPAAPAAPAAPSAASTSATPVAPAAAAASVSTPATTPPGPPSRTAGATAPAAPAAPDAETIYRNVSERLKALDKLRASGLISDQEYQEKRRELLRQL